MQAHVIIINGTGGAGKDTVVKQISKNFNAKVSNISSIDFVREYVDETLIAAHSGPFEIVKDEKYRTLLAEIKSVWDKHGNTSTDIVAKKVIDEIYNSSLYEKKLIFVHIRESHNIDKFKKEVKKRLLYKKDKKECIKFDPIENIHTLLVTGRVNPESHDSQLPHG